MKCYEVNDSGEMFWIAAMNLEDARRCFSEDCNDDPDAQRDAVFKEVSHEHMKQMRMRKEDPSDPDTLAELFDNMTKGETLPYLIASTLE